MRDEKETAGVLSLDRLTEMFVNTPEFKAMIGSALEPKEVPRTPTTGGSTITFWRPLDNKPLFQRVQTKTHRLFGKVFGDFMYRVLLIVDAQITEAEKNSESRAS